MNTKQLLSDIRKKRRALKKAEREHYKACQEFDKKHQTWVKSFVELGEKAGVPVQVRGKCTLSMGKRSLRGPNIWLPSYAGDVTLNKAASFVVAYMRDTQDHYVSPEDAWHYQYFPHDTPLEEVFNAALVIHTVNTFEG